MSQSEDIFEERFELPKNMAIYITDQNHPTQLANLPENAVPGFVVQVYRKRKCLETMWCRSRELAERMADEYARQYITMAVCGW